MHNTWGFLTRLVYIRQIPDYCYLALFATLSYTAVIITTFLFGSIVYSSTPEIRLVPGFSGIWKIVRSRPIYFH